MIYAGSKVSSLKATLALSSHPTRLALSPAGVQSTYQLTTLKGEPFAISAKLLAKSKSDSNLTIKISLNKSMNLMDGVLGFWGFYDLRIFFY